MRQKPLLEAILEELKNIHYHTERVEVFTMMAHNIKENDKGAWIEDKKAKRGIAMKDEIEGKITGITDQDTVILIYVQTHLEQGLVGCRVVCARPELFNEIKKAVGNPVGKRFFTKDGSAYIQDQKTTARLSNLDFVIVPNK